MHIIAELVDSNAFRIMSRDLRVHTVATVIADDDKVETRGTA